MSGFSRELFLRDLGAAGGETEREVRALAEVDSTSSELARLLGGGAAAGTVVVAESQRAGRGRQGRSWHSPAAGGLYISLAVDCGDRPGAVTRLPLAAGVAAVDAAVAAGAPAPVLKWPNDLVLNDRKVGGILCEVNDPRRAPGLVVVGLGLNLGRFDPPPELERIAAGLAVDEREVVAARWVVGVERWIAELARPGSEAGLVRAWRERAEPFGRRVRVGEVTGTTVDLDGQGRLLIARDDGLVVAVVGGIVENVAADAPVHE